MKKVNALGLKFVMLIGFLAVFSGHAYSQCTTTTYTVDLSANPEAVVTTADKLGRDVANCCGNPLLDDCIVFYLKRHQNSAGVEIQLSAPNPGGNGNMFINGVCATLYPGGSAQCIPTRTGILIDTLTFCKNGSATNYYTFTSKASPTFPPDLDYRTGCALIIKSYGVADEATKVTWEAIPQVGYDTAILNDYLSFTSPGSYASPSYSPFGNIPPYVDYKVTGSPSFTLCSTLSKTDTVRITNHSALTASISPANPSFCTGSSVVLTASGSGGATPYTYVWKNGSSTNLAVTSIYSASLATTYSVVVEDKVNLYEYATCPEVSQSVLVGNGQPVAVTMGSNKTVCAINPTVKLTATVENGYKARWEGGTGTYTNKISTIPTQTLTTVEATYTPTAAEIPSSVTFSLTVTGGGGCDSVTNTMTITFSDTIDFTIPTVVLSCNNSTTTLAIGSLTGGTSPYSYNWSTGATTSSISVGQGNYTAIVTDVNGCNATEFYNLVAPNALSVSLSSTDVSTDGGVDGTATATVLGGTAPYSYLWNPGNKTTTSVTGSYGIYNVTITDNNGCAYSGSVVINEPRCAGFNVTASSTDVSCYEGNDGTGTSYVTGGTPQSYSWNSTPPQTTANASGLEAGVYTITVYSTTGCAQTANITVNEPTVLTDVINSTNVSAADSTNGTATVNVFGGTAPYSYLWSPGSKTSASISSLAPGMYYVNITDANGCTRNDSVRIQEYDCSKIVLNVNVTSVSCHETATGAASIVLYGGQAASYSWSTSPVQTTASISNLMHGDYVVTVIDTSGCELFKNFTVTQPNELSSGIAVNPASCRNGTNGTADVNVLGGTYPYSYAWSNGATTEDLISLGTSNSTSITYSVVVTDAKGCKDTLSATYTNPDTIIITSVSENPTCIYGNDGYIDVTVTGGALPYTYSWSNNATTQDLDSLYASSSAYELTFTDGNGCTPSSKLSVIISDPDSVHIVSHTEACSTPGSGVSLITVTPAGGYTSADYEVSFDDGVTYQTAGDYDSLLINGGTYKIWAKDSTGCVSLSAYTITLKQTIVVSIDDSINVYCKGDDTGEVTASATGGKSPYAYSWNSTPVQTTANATGLVAGTYTVTVTDADNCIGYTTVNIEEPQDSLKISVTDTTMVLCYNNNTGAAVALATGGSGSYSYSWSTSPVQTTATATGLTAGTYTVSVSDNNGCVTPATAVVTITQPASALGASITGTTDVLCKGNNTGTATVSATGGSGFYTYLWNNAQTTATASQLIAGSYTVTVSDANGCLIPVTSVATINEPNDSLKATIAVDNNVICYGASTGQLTVNPTGGSGSYTYLWNDNQTTATATGLAAGTYTVTVSDVNGCPETVEVIEAVTQPDFLLEASVTSQTNVVCKLGTTGTATVTPTGGSGSYSYLWSAASQTTQVATGLAAGSYTVNVYDNNGCATPATATVTITEPTLALSVTITATTDVICKDTASGIATALGLGGSGNYNYVWSPGGQTTATAVGLADGTYTVTVTDKNGCVDQVTETATINEPVLALSSSITAQTNVDCNGNSTGDATVTATGGSGSYSYLWSNYQTTATATGLAAGTYSVTVSDNNGCVATVTETVTITEPITLTATASVTSNYNGGDISCNGASDGDATATPSDGTAPYTYLWSAAAQTTATATGLAAGTYTVIVTDAQNCVTSATVTLVNPPALSVFNTVSNETCNYLNDGSIEASPLGGTAPYTYSWTDAQTTQVATGLIAGNYTVTVTDVNGCSATKASTVTQPTALTISFTNQVDVKCNGEGTGAVTAVGNGGTPNYSYFWTAGSETTATISNLIADTYSVTVTDENGCVATSDVTISEAPLLTVGMASSPALCNGDSTGSMTATPAGGTAPYTYLWNFASATTDVVNNVPASNRTVIVKDAYLCTTTNTVTVSEPNAIVPVGASADATCLQDDGIAIVSSITGGIAPYTIVWDTITATPDFAGNDSLINVPAGHYTFIITDGNLCTVEGYADVSDAGVPVPTLTSKTDATCHNATDGIIEFGVTGGTPPYTIAWEGDLPTNNLYHPTTNPTGDRRDSVLSGVPAGIYTAFITDALGCKAYFTETIGQPDPLFVSILPYDVLCNGGSDGGAEVELTTGGTPNYSYNWLPGGSTGNFVMGLSANITYTLQVTDDHGCQLFETFEVGEPTLLTATASSDSVLCYGGSTGSVSALGAGGVGFYQYMWMPGELQGQDISNLPIGTYTVTVRDFNQCVTTQTVTVEQPDSLILATTSDNSTCSQANGVAHVVPTGGVAAYTYVWMPSGSTDADATGLMADTYSVAVSDSKGCLAYSGVVVSDSPSPVAAITAYTPVYCKGDNTGSATVSVTSGGTAPFTYAWAPSGGTNATATGLVAGTYTATVTDDNGCESSAAVTLQEPTNALSANISSKTNVYCKGGATGSATVLPSGGSGSYSFLWSNNATTATASGLLAGTYSVSVFDNNGCVTPFTQTVSITEPASALGVSLVSKTNVFCKGGATGSATVTGTGGSSSYYYSWSNEQSGPTAAELSAGSYTVTVYDANGCTSPVSMVVTITEPAIALGGNLVSKTNVACKFGNTGASAVEGTGGSGSYNYYWNSGQTTASVTGLTAKSYTVNISDQNGCSIPYSMVVTITEPANALSAEITSRTNILCKGSSTGSATVTASGGSLGYSYLWINTGETSNVANGLNATDTYTVMVTDNNGCTSPVYRTVKLTEPVNGLDAAISTKTNVACFGGSTGSATVKASGGSTSSAYIYMWSGIGQTTATATGLSAGTYTVSIYDINGCPNPAISTVIISQPAAALSASITATTNVYCKGGTTGVATVTAAGGSGAYNYSWNTSPVKTSATATGLAVGQYTVTVSDKNGCTIPVTAVATLTEPDSVLDAFTTKINVFCKGGATGSATVYPLGGSDSYSYLWNTGATTASISGLTAKSYTVTVTDNNGCAVPVKKVVSITEPQAPLAATISAQTNILCKGAATGIATVRVTGGSENYSYLWSNNQTTATATGLLAQTYTVVVIDNNGCLIPITQTVTITEPTVALGVTTSQLNVFCNGENTGTATAVGNGGSGLGYTYLWSNNQTTAKATGLMAQTYTVTVFDKNGCATPAQITVTITEPSTPITVSITPTNVLCYGGTTGSATAVVTGGSGLGFTYRWNNAQTTQTATGLRAETTYSVTVRDKNGCATAVAQSVTLTQPSSPINVIPSKVDVACYGDASGSAYVSVSGGSGKYYYLWNTVPAETTVSVNGLLAGDYTVTVSDTNGCVESSIIPVSISQPLAALTASITASSPVLCYGKSTGSATVSVAGGTTPYSYEWSNGQTDPIATLLAAGDYTVAITDFKGCQYDITTPVTISQPTAVLSSTLSAQTNVSCYNGNNATVTVDGLGGSGSYTYVWSTTPVQTTATASGLNANTYSVTITDNNGCDVAETRTVTVTQPNELAVDFAITNSACNNATGEIDLTVSGGVAAYSYAWSNSSTTEDLTNLEGATYTVTVTDANACTITDTATITMSVLELSLNSPKLNNDYNLSEYGSNDGSIDLTINGNYPPYDIKWSNNATTEDLSNLASGVYIVLVKDAGGCTEVASINLTEPFELELPTGISPNGDGLNDIMVVHGLNLQKGNNLKVFNRWGNLVYEMDNYQNNWGGTNQSGIDLADGTYFVILEVLYKNETLNGYLDIRR